MDKIRTFYVLGILWLEIILFSLVVVSGIFPLELVSFGLFLGTGGEIYFWSLLEYKL